MTRGNGGAFRSREFTKRCPDGKYRPNTLLILDRLAAEAFRIEVQPVAEM